KLITAVSNNTVQIHTFPEGLPDGILTRFTTNANHVVFSADGSKVAVGSSDFLVKIVDVTDSSQQKTFRGHDAPVLSVSLDPTDTFLASASCDGSVRVWKISEQNCEISWPLLQKCNDVINAKSLCRLTWQPKIGKRLAVPVEKTIKLYRRETWDHEVDLSDNFITQPLNVVAWSPCGQYLAAGSIGGYIVIWKVETQECLERVKHEKGYTVCGLAWHPKGGQLAYTDTEGNLGLLENVCDVEGKKSIHKAPNSSIKSYDELFDEDDKEDFLNRDFSEDDWGSKAATNDEDEDDFNVLGRPRNRGAIIEDDENSLDTGLLKANSALEKEKEEDDLDNFPVQPLPSDQRSLYSGPLPTPRQKPFQSGSTPTHLTHRFMIWNSVGIIRCYNDEQDNAIDVEFHDTAIHHAMHLPNNLNHTMADLSSEAILLACESTEELASKLHCIHFNSWDPSKEWTVDMLQDEVIEAICLGQGWAACATSSLLLRVFTIGGVQKEIFSFPGPVVSMAGHGEQLLVVFHKGTGFEGDQCLGIQLLELGKKKRQILHGESLPLSRKSYLAWIGFSAEGTPCYVDSAGIVRMLNRRHSNIWTPVCNTREHCKGKSNHYWIVGIHENPQQLRCILCKGARFPATLPRPAVTVLPFKLPFCQTATDKGQMEEQFWRSVLFHNYVDYLSQNGYEYDESVKGQAVQEQQNLLMKMFALSCTLEREFRCMELVEFMTQNATSLAIKYASRSRRLILAQKLSELAAEKISELASAEAYAEQEEEEEKQQPDFRNHLNVPQRKDEFLNLLLLQVSNSQKDAFVHSPNILDNLMRLPKKNLTMNGQGVPNKKSPIIKPLIPKSKSKQVMVWTFILAKLLLSDVASLRNDKAFISNLFLICTVFRPKTGFQMWLEENRSSILSDNPNFEETEIIKEGMVRYRGLSAEERMVWTEKAKGRDTSDPSEGKKRKRPEDINKKEQEGQEQNSEEDVGSSKKSKGFNQSTFAKLSTFAYKRS
uniref:WD repeat and HMG-box DNA-binding protein 1 n=1 Tax=Laticauda laticaudata TaxID=8630 RepID=A0A8C5RR37_LATLA